MTCTLMMFQFQKSLASASMIKFMASDLNLCTNATRAHRMLDIFSYEPISGGI